MDRGVIRERLSQGRQTGFIPIGVMHANGLLAFQNLDLVAHHRGFVQCWLSVEDHNVAISKVSVHLLRDLRGAGGGKSDIWARAHGRGLGGHEQVGNAFALLFCLLGLERSDGSVDEDRIRVKLSYQKRDMAILILYRHSAWVDEGTVDDGSLHSLDVVLVDRLRECELLRENWRDTDLVGLNVDIG